MPRKPYRYIIQIDGRETGEPFRSKAHALTAAEGLRETAPWPIIEVIGVLI